MAEGPDVVPQDRPAELDRQVLVSLPVGLVVHGGDGRILRANPEAERLLGLSQAQMTGLTSMDPRWRAVHEDGSDFPGETHPAEIARRTRQPVAGVVMGVHRPDGSLAWISVNATCVDGTWSDTEPAVLAVFTDISEQLELRRQADEMRAKAESLAMEAEGLRGAAKRAEDQYRLIAEHASDVVSLGTAQGRIAWVSPSVERLLGIAPEELRGTPFLDMVHPDDHPVVREVQAALAIAGTLREMSLRVRTVEGGWHWVDIQVRSVADESGSVVRVSAMRDAEPIRQEQAARRREYELRRALFETAIDPHVFVEPIHDDSGSIVDLVYMDANDAACTALHLDREALLGHTMLELFPNAADGLFSTYVAALTNGASFSIDDYRDPADAIGVGRRYDIRAVPVAGGLSFAWSDVTTRFEQAERLRLSEDRFRMMAENATDVIVRIVADTSVIDWISPSCLEVTGYTADELTGRSILDLLHPDDSSEWHKMRAAEAEGAAIDAYVSQGHRKDGSLVWVESTSQVIPGDDDRPAYRLVRLRDVGEQVRARHELEERARTDALTGLLTRREGWRRLRGDLELERREGEQIAVLFIDLDGFKAVNDSRGHQVGDVVLTAVATRLRAAVRENDYLVRVGGDEMLIVLNGVNDLRAALDVAEKVRQAVELPTWVDGAEVAVTASVGATLARPGDAISDLVHRADRAMYRAKDTGRNQVVPIV